MKAIINKMKAFFADESGAETVEWVMVAAVLSAIILAVYWVTLKGGIETVIAKIVSNMTSL